MSHFLPDSQTSRYLQRVVSLLGSIGLLWGSSLPSTAYPLPTSLNPSAAAFQVAQTLSSQPLQVMARRQTEWHTGFCVVFAITNTGTAPITNWRLRFTMNQAEIHNHWNGTFRRQGNQYTVIPANWGRNLPVGRRVDLGFCATKQGADFLPGEIAVDAL